LDSKQRKGQHTELFHAIRLREQTQENMMSASKMDDHAGVQDASWLNIRKTAYEDDDNMRRLGFIPVVRMDEREGFVKDPSYYNSSIHQSRANSYKQGQREYKSGETLLYEIDFE